MSEAKLNREEQAALGKKIAEILSKKVDPNFKESTNQGAGVIAVLKIVAYKEDVMTRIKKYLRTDLGLTLQNPKENHKNHGSGMKMTALINLSEIRTDEVNRINDLHKIICPEKCKPAVVVKKAQPTDNANATVKEVPAKKVIEIVSTPAAPAGKTEASEVAARTRKYSPREQTGQMSLSLYISSVLSFEKMMVEGVKKLDGFTITDYFKYDKKKDDDSITLRCTDEKIAREIEQLVAWHIGSSNVVRSEMDIMVDLSKMKEFERKAPHIHFTLAPKEGISVADLKKRLLRVNSGAKPKKIAPHKSTPNLFVVSYVKKTTASVVRKAVISMGWNITEELGKEDFLLIDTSNKITEEPSVGKTIQMVPAENILIASEIASTVKSPLALTEVTGSSAQASVSGDDKTSDLNTADVPANASVEEVESEEQAILVFKKVLANPEERASLPEELIIEMEATVALYDERVGREAYLKGLLNKFFKK